MDYKGYKLHPGASKKPKDRWTTKIVIEHPTLDDAEDFVFSDGALFDTEAAAEQASIELGKKIVDGEHPEYKVP